MVTLVLDAKRIPDGTEVRKPTGTTKYILRHKLKIRLPDDAREIHSNGVVFLVGEGHVHADPDTTKLAIDLDERGAKDFIDQYLVSHQ